MEFAGFSDWVEIFAGGRQTDSSGHVHDGDALIDKAVGVFDPAVHEPPAVIGHPTHDAPAFGWVEAVRSDVKDGVKRLYAKFRQVVPAFEEMVKTGRFKKRSAAFYPDGRLRHVGWLGAMPPAVKGLADVAFSEDDQAIDFEFMDPKQQAKEKKTMTFTEFMEVMKFWKKVQEDPDTAELVGAMKPKTPKSDIPGQSFSEADLAAATAEAAKTAKEAGKAEALAEFAEAEQRRKTAAAKERIKTFIADGVEKGLIAPAWTKAGLAEFMERLDIAETIEFAEGQDKKTGLQWFTDFLSGLPKLVDFSEIASRDKNVGAGNAAGKIEALITQKMKDDKALNYSAAFIEVQREHPALATEYAQELNG